MQPVPWSAERQREFMERFLVYYTGIRRIAKNLLAEVVGRYLARETATVQVLHSIKTLVVEMSYAMSEGDWDYLGNLVIGPPRFRLPSWRCLGEAEIHVCVIIRLRFV